MAAMSPGLESSLGALDTVILFAFLGISSTRLCVPECMFMQLKNNKHILGNGVIP